MFERALNLDDDQAGVLSLVAHPRGAGPFTLVLTPNDRLLGSASGFLDWVLANSDVRVDGPSLRVGRLAVDTAEAGPWEARLPWAALKARPEAVLGQLDRLGRLLAAHAPPGGLSELLSGAHASPSEFTAALIRAAAGPAQAVAEAVRRDDQPAALTAAGALAGLGGGLTPSGDDFLVGALYAHRLMAEPERADALGAEVARSAGDRTSRLSKAWLEAGGRGEASQTWHDLMNALLEGASGPIETAARELMAVGHTSGADALTGFVMSLSDRSRG